MIFPGGRARPARGVSRPFHILARAVIFLAVAATAGRAGTIPPPPVEGEPDGYAYRLTAPGHQEFAGGFVVDPGTPFRGVFTVANFFAKPLPLRIACLLDDAQVPCGGGDAGASPQATIPSGEEREFAILLPAAQATERSLLVALFLVPDNHSLDPGFRLHSDELFAAQRAILAAREPLPAPPQPPAENQPQPFVALKVGEGGKLTARVNNPAKTPLEVTLVGFLDYRQVSLLSGEPAPRRMIPAEKEILLDIPTPALAPGSGHEFQVIMVPAREAGDLDILSSPRRYLVGE